MNNEFDTEEKTQPIAFESLSEVAAKWLAQLAEDEKRLRPMRSSDVTQPLPVIP